MNIAKKNLLISFLVSLLLALLTPLLPLPNLTYFAPFLILVYYQKPLSTTLWTSFSCGLVIDLFLSSNQLGLYGTTYLVSSSILVHQRKHFFGDNLTTLPIMVFFFSLLSFLIQVVLLYFFEGGISCSLPCLTRQLVVTSLGDAAMGFILFILPWRLFGKQPRKGSDYFANRAT